MKTETEIRQLLKDHEAELERLDGLLAEYIKSGNKFGYDTIYEKVAEMQAKITVLKEILV